jgi:hypothetical protein
MARRHRNKDSISISLVPILSIQKCAMGVMVVIICAQTAISIARTTVPVDDRSDRLVDPPPAPAVIAPSDDQYLEIKGSAEGREAVYVECREKEILIHPEKTTVSLESLKGFGPSALHQLLDELVAARGKKYVVLLVRPEGIATYRHCLRMANYERNLDVGKDALLSGGNIILTQSGRPVLGAPKEVR